MLSKNLKKSFGDKNLLSCYNISYTFFANRCSKVTEVSFSVMDEDFHWLTDLPLLPGAFKTWLNVYTIHSLSL